MGRPCVWSRDHWARCTCIALPLVLSGRLIHQNELYYSQYTFQKYAIVLITSAGSHFLLWNLALPAAYQLLLLLFLLTRMHGLLIERGNSSIIYLVSSIWSRLSLSSPWRFYRDLALWLLLLSINNSFSSYPLVSCSPLLHFYAISNFPNTGHGDQDTIPLSYPGSSLIFPSFCSSCHYYHWWWWWWWCWLFFFVPSCSFCHRVGSSSQILPLRSENKYGRWACDQQT